MTTETKKNIIFHFLIYDLVTAILSILDLITDISVLTTYYIDGKDVFFTISLIIIIFAQLSYCAAFTINATSSDSSWLKKLSIFVLSLPFAPIMSYALFFMVTCIEYDNTPNNISLNDQNFRGRMKQTLSKHLGFILGMY